MSFSRIVELILFSSQSFSFGRLDRVDTLFRHHIKKKVMLKRRMSASRLFTSPNSIDITISVGVDLLELVRLLIKFKWGTIFLQELLWRMDGITKRNGIGVLDREIEKVMKMFGASTNGSSRESG